MYLTPAIRPVRRNRPSASVRTDNAPRAWNADSLCDQGHHLDVGLGAALGVEQPAEDDTAWLERDGDRIATRLRLRARERQLPPEGACRLRNHAVRGRLESSPIAVNSAPSRTGIGGGRPASLTDVRPNAVTPSTGRPWVNQLAADREARLEHEVAMELGRPSSGSIRATAL